MASWAHCARAGAAVVVVAGATRDGGVVDVQEGAIEHSIAYKRFAALECRWRKCTQCAAAVLVCVLLQQGSTSCGPKRDAQATWSRVMTLWGAGVVGQHASARAPRGPGCGSARVGGRYRSIWARCARAVAAVVVQVGAARVVGAAGRSEGASVAARR